MVATSGDGKGAVIVGEYKSSDRRGKRCIKIKPAVGRQAVQHEGHSRIDRKQ